LTIVSQYFPPETGAPQARWFDLARRFVQRGHDVQVLTALPNYPGPEIQPAYVGRQNTIELMDGIRVARVAVQPPKDRRFLSRLRCYFSFAVNARLHGPRLLQPADVLLMESPPLTVAFAAVPLASRLARRLVVNVSDLWPESAVQLGLVGPGPALTASRSLERWMYKRADLITAQTDGIADDIRRRIPSTPVVVFPNGVDLDRYPAPTHRARVRQDWGWSDHQFVIGYTGVLGHAQALHQIADAALLLRDTPVHFALFGDGPCRADIEVRIHELQLENQVHVYPSQPSSQMPSIQSAFDAGIVPLGRAALFEGARPSKMFEILAAGCPLILCARGEAERIVNSPAGHPAALVTPPEEPAALAAIVRRLISDPALCSSLARAGRQLVTERFDRAKIAEDMEQVLERLLAHGGRARLKPATLPRVAS
jgi:glycosyltransferase involved in cell wall biosynthesis